MTNQGKKTDGTVAPATATALDAPLTLPADQLELVAGGMVLSHGPFGPTTGLIYVPQ